MERASLLHGHLFSRHFWVAATQLLLCWAQGDQDRKSQSPQETHRLESQTAGTLASSNSREEDTKSDTEKKALELSVDGVWMSTAIPRGLSWSQDTKSWKERSVKAEELRADATGLGISRMYTQLANYTEGWGKVCGGVNTIEMLGPATWISLELF